MSGTEIWQFRSTSGHISGGDLIGFHVEATDGHIGKIDKLSEQAEYSYLVVDTGPWIFGKYVLLPAGTVVRVDEAARKVHVDRTRDEIKGGPEFDGQHHEVDPHYRERFATYYGPFHGEPMP
ncbi:PRC-barrel domain-containing protein [Kitasatospora sp. NBC_00070]|uniref:PRC-barrel domain-containing protein n=1 Tax=Kitasatospora sp. NBC_00070 TaxID=2975962 RepID=UPI0032442903